MGVAASSVSQTKTILPSTYFIIDRMFAANCDFLSEHAQPNIVLGIHKNSDSSNPLGRQGIRIGDGEIVPLRSFQKTPTDIRFEFENSVALSVHRRENSTTYYTLKTPSVHVTREVSPVIAGHFKDISCDSREIDSLKEIMQ